MKRILLIEDHSVFRQAIAFVLDQEPDFEVVGQAGSLAAARDLSRSNGFDVAMVDLFLPDGDGTDLIPDLRATHPGGSVVVLTISLDSVRHDKARESGADEVLGKQVSLDEIVGAVRHPGP